MNIQGIHWYPGHMKKAWNLIQASIKLVDVVIEVVDARALVTTRYQALQKRALLKHLLVINKADLADPIVTQKWVDFYRLQGLAVVVHDQDNARFLHAFHRAIKDLTQTLEEDSIKKGMKPQRIKAMIVGVPNVGKSTLINLLSGQRKVKTENRPGSTRGQQWITIANTFLLMDTPGVLPPVYDKPDQGMHLALIQAIKLDILPLQMLADYCFEFFQKHYPSLLKPYQVPATMDAHGFFEALARHRGLLHRGEPVFDKSYHRFIRDVQDGSIGRCSFEHPPA